MCARLHLETEKSNDSRYTLLGICIHMHYMHVCDCSIRSKTQPHHSNILTSASLSASWNCCIASLSASIVASHFAKTTTLVSLPLRLVKAVLALSRQSRISRMLARISRMSLVRRLACTSDVMIMTNKTTRNNRVVRLHSCKCAVKQSRLPCASGTCFESRSRQFPSRQMCSCADQTLRGFHA